MLFRGCTGGLVVVRVTFTTEGFVLHRVRIYTFNTFK